MTARPCTPRDSLAMQKATVWKGGWLSGREDVQWPMGVVCWKKVAGWFERSTAVGSGCTSVCGDRSHSANAGQGLGCLSLQSRGLSVAGVSPAGVPACPGAQVQNNLWTPSCYFRGRGRLFGQPCKLWERLETSRIRILNRIHQAVFSRSMNNSAHAMGTCVSAWSSMLSSASKVWPGVS